MARLPIPGVHPAVAAPQPQIWVALACRNLEASVAWWRQWAGLQLVHQGRDVCTDAAQARLTDELGLLVLVLTESSQASLPQGGSTPPKRARVRLLLHSLGLFEQRVARAQELGLLVGKPDASDPLRGPWCEVTSPEGERVELCVGQEPQLSNGAPIFHPGPINRHSAPSYLWGGDCRGWHLLRREELSVIEEEMPSGRSEVRHLHRVSHQFFRVLSGRARMEVGAAIHTLRNGEGIAVPPGVIHRFSNPFADPVQFLVISSPLAHGDRVEVHDLAAPRQVVVLPVADKS